MTALETILSELILEGGPISLERYMTLALSHPVHGYYRSKEAIGAKGDFITSPEISQMFGELLGLWCVEVWRLMGAPEAVRLVELGPGRGTLMADALRAVKVAPDFLAALEVHLVEISLPLREAQRAALEGRGVKVVWHASVDEIPPGPAIFIANEFFDALPVRHYVHRDGGWRERLIGLDENGRLAFGLGATHETAIAARGEADDVLEVGVAASRLMTQLAVRIVTQGGALLAIDYGYTEPARGETLQAMRAHQFVDPLADPGEADLTTHVNFSSLMRSARGAGAAVHGPVEQGRFLTRLGIFERAAMLKHHASQAQSAAIDAARERLAGEGPGLDRATDMARLFKVLAVTRREFDPPPGFEEASNG
ncbi:Methyltransferase [Methylocella tundrae]|uniref:Methyltransferase n=1 Tax=Methylocella tundrae TaxID=227605 RepID=A0A8B6MAD0_METTU|nr:SAM-dependent methyltransferase [Methylocella tundrae]VTZ51004.1 Methyltransferase [Methylocella tundrae]